MGNLLEVNHLNVVFKTHGGEVKAVRDVSFQVDRGDIVAIVGESGSGKSVTVKTIAGLMSASNAEIRDGNVLFDGEDLLQMSDKELRKVKGSKMSMVFQDSMTSLNPTMKIGKQIEESIKEHTNLPKNKRKEQVITILKKVGIPNPELRAEQYPHEFSGGMRQRVMIAIALACNPELVIADEPTTALDVTIQAQILELLKDLQANFDTSIILITHDLGVVAETAEKVIVMYAGMMVEKAPVDQIFKHPSHPYTEGLIKSMPDISTDKNERLIPIDGSPPDLFFPPKGCPFVDRCEYAMEVCEQHIPPEFKVRSNHYSRCWLHDERAGVNHLRASKVGEETDGK
ncbi:MULTISPECIES: ABC transporter ATP-binding protein [unclassified Sporosarcina]|uniref:ABC transporter ATP-binding protein n=1 Tax=unclassified Sporosarcina TaxID=2647733 RepID=UPI00204025C1|nr:MULTISPECIES: ABC transporter ATP-binding protein [unclassified Sporosarcina]